MPKQTIQIAVLGQPPLNFNPRDLATWSSKAFAVSPDIQSFPLSEDASGPDWEFNDDQFEKIVRRDPQCSILIIFVKVKLQNNWYLRRLSDNRIVFTFYEMDQILRFHRLPLKNLALRVLYASTLIYLRFNNRIPLATEKTNYAHDETRGCLFDMNSNKIDVVSSLHKPVICESCQFQSKNQHVSNELLYSIQRELRRIKKPLIDRIYDFARERTILAIAVSILSALAIGILASVLAALIYDSFR